MTIVNQDDFSPGKIIGERGAVVVEEERVVGERTHGNADLIKGQNFQSVSVTDGPPAKQIKKIERL